MAVQLAQWSDAIQVRLVHLTAVSPASSSISNLDGLIPGDGSGRFDIGCPNILLMFISATGPRTGLEMTTRS